jgi:hypothetical protein
MTCQIEGRSQMTSTENTEDRMKAEDRIRVVAYRLWEEEGCPEGREEEHWFRACAEVEGGAVGAASDAAAARPSSTRAGAAGLAAARAETGVPASRGARAGRKDDTGAEKSGKAQPTV